MKAAAGLVVVCLLLATSALAQPRAETPPEVGRLFFTPAQRQDLDRRRQLNIQEAMPAALEPRLTLNGQVTRSSGRTTTWVNGSAEHDAYKPRDPAVVAIRPGDDSANVPLRVGQTLDNGRGEVTDGLAGGRLEIRRAPRPQR